MVDDERALCEALQDFLAKRGFEVAWRTSAQDGLDLLRDEEFDVVVTDIQMGRMGGIELCTRIAESWPNLPTIVMTAFGSVEVAVAAIRAGAYDFLVKPIEQKPWWWPWSAPSQHHRLGTRSGRSAGWSRSPRTSAS